jgi:hypothetical protein
MVTTDPATVPSAMTAVTEEAATAEMVTINSTYSLL